MEYELVNPSDPYVFVAKSKEVAALVVACLTTAFGAKTKDGEGNVPVFIFGGFEEWYEEEFGRDCNTGLEVLKKDVADALDSFMYGHFEDRERYDTALRCITEPDKKEEFREKWNDGRSSMNDIGTYAHRLAKRIKENML